MIRTITFLFVLFGLAVSAHAELATVRGGEHADFTRLVIESSNREEWKFGRNDDGYELDLGNSTTAFDLERAFERIPQDRVKAIWRDPENGRLRFSLACECHAIAFEFRPGIVVIDVKSGLPPPKSSFENRLDPDKRISEHTSSHDIDLNYNWLAVARSPSKRIVTEASFLPAPAELVSLAPFQNSILNQISAGSAKGIVDVAKLPQSDLVVLRHTSDSPWSRLGLAELPGLRVGPDRVDLESITINGEDCLEDDDLNVESWGLTGPISEQMGLGRSGLLLEFDMPLPEAILRAARFHIFLGFGAEARQQLSLLTDLVEPATYLIAMSYIVDGTVPNSNPFEGMEGCDSAAALWAALSKETNDPLLPQTNLTALTRSFSALPPHLRQHLGGALVDQFLAIGDDRTARTLRDSIVRSAAKVLPNVSLMDAQFLLSQGDTESTSRLAKEVLDSTGTMSPQLAIAIVDAAFQGNRTVEPSMASTIESFLYDAQMTPLGPNLLRAFVLSAAMAGDFPTAFRGLNDSPDTFPELWSLVLQSAPVDIFLVEAAQQPHATILNNSTLRKKTATRLLDLGFPDLALRWLAPISGVRDEETRIIVAIAYMKMRNPQAALNEMIDLESSDSAVLRAEALNQLSDPMSATEILLQIGETDAGQRQLSWTQDWKSIEKRGSENWKVAAQLVEAQRASAASGKISHSTAILAESQAARAKIESLLESISSASSNP